MRRLWQRICAFFYRLYLGYLAERVRDHEPTLKEVLRDPAKRALYRITCEGLCPPDTVSMGLMRGAPAVFFTHDLGKEVFIGRDYDHAADEFIKWMRESAARGAAYIPKTKKTTLLARHERRAYASKKFRNKQK